MTLGSMLVCITMLVPASQRTGSWRIVASLVPLQKNYLLQPWDNRVFCLFTKLWSSAGPWTAQSSSSTSHLKICGQDEQVCFPWDSLMQPLNSLIPPRVALESGTKQSNFAGKYVKTVPKVFAIPSGTHVASYFFFFLVVQNSDNKFLK